MNTSKKELTAKKNQKVRISAIGNTGLVSIEIMRNVHGQDIRSKFATRRVRHSDDAGITFIKIGGRKLVLPYAIVREVNQEGLTDNTADNGYVWISDVSFN